ncbi:MAG: T9SS type A sorting domain-containing protein [Flavobacteriaceae bacterium]|nr:T9SS type A sorting domain-containing protein [Flavobacteriaceae bacterium]
MKTLLLFFIGIITAVTYAQDGTLDTSFGNNGYAITDFFGGTDRGSAIAVQEDGKIVVFGFVDVGSTFSYGLLRHLPNGQLDTSFGTDGFVITPAGDNFREYFSSLHIQNDQKIIASTTFIDNGNLDYMLMRYMPDGDVDPSFGVNGIVKTHLGSDYLASTNLLSNGKIMAGGSATINGTDNHIFLARYLSNGELDPSFGNGGTIAEFINNETLKVFGIASQDDGKILVPYFTIENFEEKFKLKQYLSNGDPDNSFGSGGIVETNIDGEIFTASMTLQQDGKILQSYRARGQQPINIRGLLSDGILDTSFATDGILEIYNDRMTVLKILVDDDSNLLVFGPTLTFFEIDDNLTYRFKPDGTLDNSFGNNGRVYLPFEGGDIAFQENGKILIAGNTFFYSGSGENFAVARLNNGPLSVPEFEQIKTTIYPNPSNGVFTIESNFHSEKEAYQITDITGKTIASGELGDKQTQIDLSSAQSGTYFLKTSYGLFRLLKN